MTARTVGRAIFGAVAVSSMIHSILLHLREAISSSDTFPCLLDRVPALRRLHGPHANKPCGFIRAPAGCGRSRLSVAAVAAGLNERRLHRGVGTGSTSGRDVPGALLMVVLSQRFLRRSNREVSGTRSGENCSIAPLRYGRNSRAQNVTKPVRPMSASVSE